MKLPRPLFLTRRQMFRLGGVSMTGCWMAPAMAPLNAYSNGGARVRGSARFCLFVMLDGGQSHVDRWDLKEGKWTPEDFDIREVRPGVKWPMALYPGLARQLDRVALVRGMEAWDSVHGRAQYYVQSAHSLNPALQKEVPAVGSVVALETWAQRRPSDILPPYVAFNVTQSQAGLLKSGFLPARYAPFHVDTATGMSAYALAPEERAGYERRWAMLQDFDARLRHDPSPEAKAFRDYNDHYQAAHRMITDPRTEKLFRLDPGERKRYGSTITGDAAILARNLIEADAGTRFLFLQQNGWDHHKDIYSRENFYRLSHDLDAALAALIEDLASRKRPGGRTLLDETLVICMGEFGRTPGALTEGLKGRDHYQYAMTALVAGGGVRGGRVIGGTDAAGAKVVNPGWGVKRSIYMEDVAATIYSALGIDWKKSIRETPSGREFYYIEPFAAKEMIATREIAPLFEG